MTDERTKIKATWCFRVGLIAFVVGLYLIWKPLAFVAFGLLLMAVAVQALEDTEKDESRND